MNAHKHRHQEQAIRGCPRLEPKGMQSGSGALTSPDANNNTAGVESEPKSIPVSNAEHGNAAILGHAVSGHSNRKAGRAGAAWRGPKKPTPGCNAPDMPTSVWSGLARKSVEPPQLGTANHERCQSLSAYRSFPPNGAQRKRPHTSQQFSFWLPAA